MKIEFALMNKQLIKLIGIYFFAIKRFYEDNYTYRVASLAYTTLLALVPLLLVVVFFISIFPIFSQFVELSESYILRNFVPETAIAVEKYLHGFTHQAQHLPMMSVLFLFVTAIMLVRTIEETFNEMWQVPNRERKFLSLIVYWLSVLVIPNAIGLTIFISTYILSFSWIKISGETLGLTPYIFQALPILISIGIFTILYKIAPNTSIKWWDAFIGGLNAAFLLLIARSGFALYMQKYPSYEVIYGSFALIPIFLLWLYIFWFIVLFAGLISYSSSILKSPTS